MKIMVVGDISLGRTIEKYNVINHISNNIIQLLKKADISFCNLESPLTNSIEKQIVHYSKLLKNNDTVYIKSYPENAKILSDMGFSIVSIANNHIMDYKDQGLKDTIKALYFYNIRYVGAGLNLLMARKPEIIEKNENKIGFLAYSFTYEATNFSAGCAPLWPPMIKKDIEKLKERCNIIVVSLHFGEEYDNSPSFSEIKFCRSLIDNGATVILGHHSHVLRGIERYKDGLIAYGLGNFIFDSHICDLDNDQDIKEKTRETMILELEFNNNQLEKWKIHPIYINNIGFPIIPLNGKKQDILKNINNDLILKVDDHKTDKNKFYSKRLIPFIKLFSISVYKGNITNVFLLLMRVLVGVKK